MPHIYRSDEWHRGRGVQLMITIKASQKIFTYAEVANLTGICAEHLHNFANRHRLGFITRAAKPLANQAQQWLVPPWALMALAALFPPSTHNRRDLSHSIDQTVRPYPP